MAEQHPDALVAMRLADMTKMHPAQDESRTCAECGWRVAIYPSGQRALRDFPEMRIMCSRCVFDKGDPAALNIACAAARGDRARAARELRRGPGMSVDRQFGVHELPGTEQPAPQIKRETVSAGFEMQMRGYVNAIWAKLGELEGRIEAVSSRPLLASAAGEARGGRERIRSPSSPKPEKPWEAAGVSRRTWFRKKKKPHDLFARGAYRARP